MINRMITTSPGVNISLYEGIYLAQQKNQDRGLVVKKSPGRFGADALNMYPGYSVKFANLNQATKAYDLNQATKANENSRVKATQKTWDESTYNILRTIEEESGESDP